MTSQLGKVNGATKCTWPRPTIPRGNETGLTYRQRGQWDMWMSSHYWWQMKFIGVINYSLCAILTSRGDGQLGPGTVIAVLLNARSQFCSEIPTSMCLLLIDTRVHTCVDLVRSSRLILRVQPLIWLGLLSSGKFTEHKGGNQTERSARMEISQDQDK